MFEYLYETIQKAAFYLVLVTAVMQAAPGKDYKKYIRFFTGLVLILMLAAPILKVFGTEIGTVDFYENEEYRQALQEFEESFEEADEMKGTEEAEETEAGAIKVEEIRLD